MAKNGDAPRAVIPQKTEGAHPPVPQEFPGGLADVSPEPFFWLIAGKLLKIQWII